MCMNTSPNGIETLIMLRFIGIDILFDQITLYHGITQRDSSGIKNSVFLKRKTSWNHRPPKFSVSVADKNIRICMGIPIKILRR